MKPLKFKSKIKELKHLKGMLHFTVPNSVVKKIGKFTGARFICEVNGELSYQCGMVALGKGEAYITITKKRLDILELKKGDTANVSLTPDASMYGMEMPEELHDILKSDTESRRRFDRLTPGKQRNIIRYVGSVKSPEKRLERAELLIENLKTLVVGKETMRGLLGIE